MQTTEMINETPDFVPPIESSKPSEQFLENNVELLKVLEQVVERAGAKAFKQFVDRLVTPPAKIPVPVDDKIPGVDTITLSPEEWKYFVEEVKTKNLYTAVNNAKYLADLDRAFSDDEEEVTMTMEELRALIHG